MISYFPYIYPDELLYSQLARYYTKSGYTAFACAVDDLFVHKYVSPDIEFISELKQEAVEILTRNISMETIIEKHTMFPSYGRFLPKEKKHKAFKDLIAMHGNFNNLLAIPKRRTDDERYLRYCPECAKADRDKYGETYWHRNHQIVGVNICPIHVCYLENSSVSMNRKSSPSLTAAENEAVISTGRICDNETEIKLAEYIIQVFQSPMNYEEQMPIGEFLHFRLNKEKYLTKSKAMTNISILYSDYQAYYNGIDQMQPFHLQKIFSGHRFNFYDICQIALFEQITPSELVKIPMDDQRQNIRSVFSEVASELHIDYNTVKIVGEAVLKRYQKNGRVQRKCTYNSYAWEQMDSELLPSVKIAIKQVYGCGMERPRRVTIGAVRRKMNLPEKRFDKLPMCKAEILKHQETQKEYWAREVVWAYNMLVSEGKPTNWKHIRVLTNMRNIDFQNCKPYLSKYADAYIVETIQGILP